MSRSRKIFCLVILFICLVFFCFPISKRESLASTSDRIPAEIMRPDVEYSQTFRVPLNDFYKIEIPIATYGVENSAGSVSLKLYRASDLVSEKTINLADISDNSTVELRFDPLSDSRDETFRLAIAYADYEKGDSLCFFTSDPEAASAEEASEIAIAPYKIDASPEDSALLFTIYGKNRHYIYNIWWIFLIFALSAVVFPFPDGSAAKKPKRKRAKNA